MTISERSPRTTAGAGREAAKALADLWWRDGIRAWRSLAVRALIPLLLLGIVALAGVLREDDDSSNREVFTVAVAGDVTVITDSLDSLIGDRLIFVPSTDPSFDTAFGADVGVVIPSDTRDRLDRGLPAELEIHEKGSDASSRAAGSLLRTATSALTVTAALDTDPAAQLGLVRFSVLDVQRTREGGQSLYSQVIAALVALHMSMLVGAAAARLGGRRHSAQMRAVLLLPLPSRALVRAAEMAEVRLALLAALPLLLPAALGALAFALVDDGIGAAAVVAVGFTLAVASLAWFDVSMGVAIGVRSSSSEQVSFASSLAVLGTAVLVGLVALGDRPPPAAVAIVPVAGVIDGLRRSAAGEPLGLLLLVVATASTAAVTLLLSRLTAGAATPERLGNRPS